VLGKVAPAGLQVYSKARGRELTLNLEPRNLHYRREELTNMYESGDLRKGLKIEIDGEPYIIVQFEFSKPGKGQSLYKCKLKNMVTGSQFDRTFRSNEKFKEPDLEEQEMEYLYSEGDRHCFMNTSTYDQEFLTDEQISDAKNFLKENTVCNILLFEGRPIGISLPYFVNLRVEKTDPWVRGDTASGDSKPATLETGYVIQVPPFIEEGEFLKIDTRTGEYVERVKG
jgi:elongation factor P